MKDRRWLTKMLHERRPVTWQFIGSLIAFLFGCRMFYIAFTKHGSGIFLNEDTEPYPVPESEYKLHFYTYGTVLFVITIFALRSAFLSWKERDALEKTWLRMVSDPEQMRDIYKHPHVYRDDFKAWVSRHHPHLKVWTVPPNAAN